MNPIVYNVSVNASNIGMAIFFKGFKLFKHI